MKLLLKKRFAIIELFLLIVFGIYTFFSCDIGVDHFETFVKDYYDLMTEYKFIDKPMVIFQTSPVMLFFFFHGVYFYREWSIENIYFLVRYDKRSKYSVKNLLILLLQSSVMSLVFVSLLLSLYAVKSKDKSIDLFYLISLLLVMITVYYSMALLFSIISLKKGSIFGCIGSFIIWDILVFVSLYIVYNCKNETVLVSARILLPSVEMFDSIVSEKYNIFSFVIPVIQIILLIICNVFYIKRIDIGLCDKEAE